MSHINKEEITRLILEGKTIPELQEYYKCSRTTITQFKKDNGLVGLSPNSKKLNRELGEKECTTCKQVLPLTRFYSNGKTQTGKTKYKPSCITCENLDRKNKFKDFIYEYLDTKNKKYCCERCGITGIFGSLDFHHVDPKTKLFNIGNNMIFSDSMIEELEKCILLCPNCHRQEHLLMGPI